MVVALAALMGLVLGSFATVLVARVPAGEQVVRGRSKCRGCSREIAWYDNVPVFSWLILRGRCRHCGERISARYPLIELSTALLSVAAVLWWGMSVTTLLFVYLAVVSVALVAIDLMHRRLPHSIVLPSYGVAVVLAVVAWVLGERTSWWSALLGFGILVLFYGLLFVLYPRGMGFGDVTTAGLLGFAAGFLGLSHLAVAAIAGPLLGGVMVIALMARGKVGRKTAIPYGPALIVGAWVGFLWGEPVATWYLRLMGVA